MENRDKKVKRQRIASRGGWLLILSLAILGIGWFLIKPTEKNSSGNALENSSISMDSLNRVENGIHLRTGLKEDEGLMTVVTHCTACHSAQLVIQNRMNEERWNATIRWMQETQNLWDLGENQQIIVDYLVKNYPPTEKGRRENLQEIEWYDLKD